MIRDNALNLLQFLYPTINNKFESNFDVKDYLTNNSITYDDLLKAVEYLKQERYVSLSSNLSKHQSNLVETIALTSNGINFCEDIIKSQN